MSDADGSPKPTCSSWTASDSKTTAAVTLIHEDHESDLDDDNYLDYVPGKDDSCNESSGDCDSDMSSDNDFEGFKQCSDDDVDKCSKDKFVYAVDNQHIYIRAVTDKDGKRVQNQKHCCLKCGRMVLHLGDHLKIHKGDGEIDAIIAGKENQKVVKKDKQIKGQPRLSAQELYPNRGDHRHNMAVLKKKKGELIVARRPSTSFSVSNYGPCPKCLLWMTKTNLGKHIDHCVTVKKFDSDLIRTSESLCTDRDIITERIPVVLGEEMKKEVLGHNVQHLFKHRALNEVSFEEIRRANSGVEAADGTPSDVNPARKEALDEDDLSGKELKENGTVENLGHEQGGVEVARGNTYHGTVSMNSSASTQHGGTLKRRHESWKSLQNELYSIFKDNYNALMTPNRAFIQSRLVLCNASLALRNRGIANILKKISADINKKRNQEKSHV